MHSEQLASHAPHTVFAFAVQVVVTYSFALHVLHAAHVPPARYLLPAQLVHWLAAAPEHDAHATLQVAQMVFAVVEHAVAWYSLASHVLQARHAPPLL